MADFFALGPQEGNYPKVWKYGEESGIANPKLRGILTRVDRVPRVNMKTNKPERWDNGELKYDFRLTIQDAAGDKWYWFMKSWWKASSNQAVVNGIKNAGVNAKSLNDIGGMEVCVSTENLMRNGEVMKYGGWSAGNPRPWQFDIIGPGDNSLWEGCHDDMDISRFEKNDAPAEQPQQQPQYESSWQAAQAKAGQAMGYQGATPYDDEIPF